MPKKKKMFNVGEKTCKETNGGGKKKEIMHRNGVQIEGMKEKKKKSINSSIYECIYEKNLKGVTRPKQIQTLRQVGERGPKEKKDD